jgi:hypothetical protein
MIEARGDPMRHCGFQRIVVQNVDSKKEPQFGLAPRRFLSFLTDTSE